MTTEETSQAAMANKTKEKKVYRINGFEQLDQFQHHSIVYCLSPHHRSLYFFLFLRCNKLGWPESFFCSFEDGMHGSRIGNKSTYYKCLKELHEYKLIRYKPGKNGSIAPLIHLVNLTKVKVRKWGSNDDATGVASGASTEVSTGKKNNYITINFKNQMNHDAKR